MTLPLQVFCAWITLAVVFSLSVVPVLPRGSLKTGGSVVVLACLALATAAPLALTLWMYLERFGRCSP